MIPEKWVPVSRLREALAPSDPVVGCFGGRRQVGQDHAQRMTADDRHLPQAAAIDAYGKGGFRFGNMSHRGSILCLPDAIWAWPVTKPEEIDRASLARVFAAANGIDTLIIGTGTEVWLPPSDLREALRAQRVVLDAMQTGPAIRTYNIMIGEGRRVAAALIAVP